MVKGPTETQGAKDTYKIRKILREEPLERNKAYQKLKHVLMHTKTVGFFRKKINAH